MVRIVEMLLGALVVGLALLARFGLLGDAARLATPGPAEQAMTSASPWSKDHKPRPSTYYANCAAAQAAGAAPIYRGQPGYRIELDRDGDGIACEPYRPR